jgi:ankyrin repeat protein
MTESHSFAHSLWLAIVEDNLETFINLLGNTDKERHENVLKKIIVPRPNTFLNERKFYTDYTRECPFVLSAIYARHTLLEYMLNILKSNVNYQDDNGNNVLVQLLFSREIDSCDECFVKCVQLILSNNYFDVNHCDTSNRSALMFCAENEEQYHTIRMLLKHCDIDVNMRDINGDNALMYASLWALATNVRILLHATRIQLNTINNHKQTALYLCGMYARTSDSALLCARQLLNKNEINVDYMIMNEEESMTAMSRCVHDGKWHAHALLVHGRI